MKFVLLTCATASEEWSEEAVQLYHRKISAFVGFEIKELKIKKGAREDRQNRIKSDSDLILDQIKPDDFVVLFDERGQQFESRKFAENVQRILNSGKQRALWIIGGAYGVDDRIRERAQLQVSLSKLVMNHLVAQLVSLEQIYRAFTILKNLPYHND